MADFSQWIGKQCNLLSKQGIRYTGILVNVDHTVAKIQVSNVRSFGTENRPTPVFIPPIEQPFPLIEFMANDLSDLQFDTPVTIPATYTPANQPVSTPGPPTSAPIAPPTPSSPSTKTAQTGPAPQPAPQFTSFSAERAPPPVNVPPTRAPEPAPSAQLERAMGKMNLSNGHADTPRGRGGQRGERGRGRGRPPIPAASSIPTTDFDFQTSNQRFDKKATVQEHPALQQKPAPPTDGIAPSDAAESSKDATSAATGAESKKDQYYNPTKSFFDNISSDANKMKTERPASGADRGGGRGRGRGRGFGRSRRDEERDKNVETFGEAGSIGLLGTGQYISGFGGGGGNGGSRGRRRRGAPRTGGGGGGTRGRGVPRAVVADA